MTPNRPDPNILYSPVPTNESQGGEEHRPSIWKLRMVPCKRFLKQCKNRLRHVVPFLCVMAYACIGGAIFWHIEGSHAREEQNSVAVRNEHEKNVTAYKILKTFADDVDEKYFNNETVNAYDMYGDVMKYLQEYARKLGLPSEDVTEWTFWGSVFFSATVCTSIGYGNMAPKTTLGKSITMLYAIIGIPLVLYTLSIIGKFFCMFIWKGYSFSSRLCFGWKRQKQSKDITDFPIWWAILFTAAWILTCAAVFGIWEGWDYFTSIYFFFQSLTTIGFGDVAPNEPMNMIFGFIFIIIGMGLVSMCWNLIQMKVEKFVGDLMTKIREKYVQSELNESLMEGEGVTDVEKEIEKISSQESSWLTSLMGKHQQHSLADEWRRRARLRNKGVQTELEYADQEVNNVPEVQDDFAQTVDHASTYFVPFRDLQSVPYREIKRQQGYGRFGSSNDDFKKLLHDISSIISDCRQTVSRDTSMSNISNIVTESDRS